MRAVGYLIGAGSMSLGIEEAGFELARPWETPGYSKNARSWDANRPQHRHHVMELKEYGAFPGAAPETDLVYGNPPCGGLSPIGAPSSDNPTNRHMVNWLRMVAASRPRAILMENGFALATPSGAALAARLGEILDHAGYAHCVWVFNSWQLGTPQSRRRCFLAALRDHSVTPDFVAPDLPDTTPVDSMPTTVIGDLKDIVPSPGRVEHFGQELTAHWYDDYGWETQKLVDAYWPKFEKHYLSKLLHKANAHSEDLSWLPQSWKKAYVARLPVSIGDGYKPSPTVTSGYRLVHWGPRRLLTMRELARLTGYPDWWKFKSLNPALVAQGVPKWNAKWAAARIAAVLAG